MNATSPILTTLEMIKIMQHLGATCRQARLDFNMTQPDIAEKVGISDEFYARIERGHAQPSLPVFIALAMTLSISTDEMLDLSNETRSRFLARGAKVLSADPPEIRRIVRQLRKASPRVLAIVAQLLKEFEEMDRRGPGAH